MRDVRRVYFPLLVQGADVRHVIDIATAELPLDASVTVCADGVMYIHTSEDSVVVREAERRLSPTELVRLVATCRAARSGA